MSFSIETALSVLLPLQIIAILSYYFIIKKTISYDFIDKCSLMMKKITLPCLVFSCFLFGREKGSVSLKIIVNIALAALCIKVLQILLAYICYKNNKSVIRKPSQYSMVFESVESFGFPLMYALGGKDGLTYCAVFYLVSRIVSATYGEIMMKKREKRYNAVKAFVTPTAIAFVLGLVLYITRVPVPTYISSIFFDIGRLTPYICMVIVGSLATKIILFREMKRFSTYFHVLFKLVITPLVVLAVSVALKIDNGLVYVCVILSSLPASLQTYSKSLRVNYNETVATSNVVISSLFSVITIPLVMLITKLMGV